MKIISTAGSTWSAAHLARLAAGALDTWIQIQIQIKYKFRYQYKYVHCTNMNALVQIPKCFKKDISASPPRRIPRER